MLPLPAFQNILEHLEDTRMGYYIELAQINRAWRRFFLSDYAWTKFDVHNVRGQRTVYKFGDYELVGIAAHYYNWLCTLFKDHRAWHMLSAPPCWHYSANLYDQMNCIGRLSNSSKYVRNSQPPRGFLAQIHIKVWELWVTHPHLCRWVIEPSELEPFLSDRRMVLSILGHTHSHDAQLLVAQNFMNDRAVIMELVVRCPWTYENRESEWLDNIEFFEEAIRRNPQTISIRQNEPQVAAKLVLDFPNELKQFLRRRPMSFQYFIKFLSAKLICEYVMEIPSLWYYAGDLKDNDAHVYYAAERDLRESYIHASLRLRLRKDFAHAVCVANPNNLGVMPRKLRNDTGFVLECWKRDPCVYFEATHKVRLYLRLRLLLLRHWPEAFDKETTPAMS